MPSKFSCRQLRETGQRFENFLVDRGQDRETDRERLRTIYNQDFKTSFGTPAPGFSSMLYGMKIANLAYVTKTRVRFFGLDRWADVWFPEKRRMKPGLEMSKHHRSLLATIFHDRAEYMHGKHGVNVEVQGPHEARDGQLLIRLDLNRKEVLTLRLRNGGTQPVTLTHLFPFCRTPQFSFCNGDRELPCLLGPGECYELHVHCKTSFVGYFPATVLWELLGPGEPGSEGAGTFYIARFLAAVAHSPLAAQLKPTTPFKRTQVSRNPVVTRRIEEGERPDRAKNYDLEFSLPLGTYYPPPRLRQLLPVLLRGTSIFTAPKEIAEIKAQLQTTLKWRNYEVKLRLLLHLEELQMEHDIRHYDLESVPMTWDPIDRNPRLLTLEVPGVAESRPSVLRGDHLFALLSSETHHEDPVTYKGFVHKVELDRVKLSFSTSLLSRFVDGLTFKVNFTFNRQPLRVQHRALELTGRWPLEPMLFPVASRGVPLLPSDVKLKLYDRSLESNPEQLQAMKHIVMGTTRPAPYIIFGPPGTGKTVTLVEAIKQVVKHLPKAHILACAPSNSGADLLCQRLRVHLPSSIYRLLAPSRDIHLVPEDIKPCCNWDAKKGDFVFPSKKKLQEYRVLITTLITASRLVSAQFPIDHFTHIFIDEAGHAMEPESLVAIAGLMEVKEADNPGGQLVLAGDPRQLGPVLRCPLTQKHGLGYSLLERLLTFNALYKKGPDGYNPQFITKLLRNYRSHPTILDVPNRLYYDGELQACADVVDRERFCRWEGLPRQDFPIIFHGVMGKDEREGNSPSFFNPEEAATVTSYLKQLLAPSSKKGKARLSPRSVGVISPYRKQVEKIRYCITKLDKQLRGLDDIKDLKVGSVEEFQGQERSVILISTVRSSQSFVQLDLDFNLGFLKNPKRFNVAVTRAKALLIVVGNPLLLGHDPDWKVFLEFCKENGGYTGCPFPAKLDLQQGQNLLQGLSKLSPSTSGLKSHDYLPQEREGEEGLSLQVEPEWRNEL
ncbi:helicase MOV-10 isoform X2 [Bos indicus]|uniref:Putative helicase MOV-10 n=6 Tax=Bovinae TaxID=27592 RepID=MOV10_BOVIN|nr:putative helicase MOV-10 [Bos taurus]XP_005887152.1 PREDICTED: putative helicase MOV-10 [Bos mutus]XP_005887153.1 PREDICTED: putative helicase MOV-10 [Bos mutus]XP_010829100.1 PREDICTED: putative helicase MOV-10 isoform X1 [Bison bison bison]XP_010829101.1 PREDICTED: putative helicase MOV-10 isoform X1 [Bison bison bison]XP_014332494.1 PREDICTED: putative helicase MOV-10 [Bos mutus]XP_019812362.1 PREDICTED: putative helicase MOV-10 isoform X1 [Bos indicus]XP_019812363.1 PREDICTED: putativ